AVINRVIAFSEKRFTDPALSLATLAEELGYNAKYLSHLFKERMGLGYAEYLRSLRVKFAVSLFDHGIDSVKNVAALSGFSDPLYFSTVFKKTVGVSPKEYKNKK
ncbi:MAG: helix-turn-helix transcriptional regulator, partial [Clostridia bacterium]|nr:helix-turn-helix transcriptional regulator [Clostridia bacterium]